MAPALAPTPPAAAGDDDVAPGPRARRLRETYAHALKRTLAAALGPSALAACFPTLAARAAPILAQVRAQMVDKLADKCEREFESICAARQVVARLNALEALVADASERRTSAQDGGADVEPTPPHLLLPAAVLAAHMATALAPHQSLLNARLQTLQAQNSLLAHHVRAQRADLDSLVARLDAALADVRAANAALAPVAAQLAHDARAAPAAAIP